MNAVIKSPSQYQVFQEGSGDSQNQLVKLQGCTEFLWRGRNKWLFGEVPKRRAVRGCAEPC